jgi:hypothetical protein
MKQAVTGLPTNPYGSSCYTVNMTPADFNIRTRFLIKGMTIKGPEGSALQVFREDVFISTTPRGDLNTWDPSQVLPMFPSQTLYFYWSVGTGSPIPLVTIDVYTDDIL